MENQGEMTVILKYVGSLQVSFYIVQVTIILHQSIYVFLHKLWSFFQSSACLPQSKYAVGKGGEMNLNLIKSKQATRRLWVPCLIAQFNSFKNETTVFKPPQDKNQHGGPNQS